MAMGSPTGDEGSCASVHVSFTHAPAKAAKADCNDGRGLIGHIPSQSSPMNVPLAPTVAEQNPSTHDDRGALAGTSACLTYTVDPPPGTLMKSSQFFLRISPG